VTTLHPLDVLVIAVYFIVLLVIGVRIARRERGAGITRRGRRRSGMRISKPHVAPVTAVYYPRTADFCTVAAGSGTDPIPEIRHAI
jgi:hypothetical protein